MYLHTTHPAMNKQKSIAWQIPINDCTSVYSHPKYCIADLLQDDKTHKIPNQRLKDKLLDKHILVNQCYSCGIHGFWKGKPLAMQLMHMDGNGHNNSLSNLIMTCPNCYSQMKRKLRPLVFIDTCIKCGKNIPNGQKLCVPCIRLQRPSKEQLQKELIHCGFQSVQDKYGVDKTTIMEWINL